MARGITVPQGQNLEAPAILLPRRDLLGRTPVLELLGSQPCECGELRRVVDVEVPFISELADLPGDVAWHPREQPFDKAISLDQLLALEEANSGLTEVSMHDVFAVAGAQTELFVRSDSQCSPKSKEARLASPSGTTCGSMPSLTASELVEMRASRGQQASRLLQLQMAR